MYFSERNRHLSPDVSFITIPRNRHGRVWEIRRTQSNNVSSDTCESDRAVFSDKEGNPFHKDTLPVISIWPR